MIERAFGRRPPWSVGVEEEIMLVDAETLELVPASADLLDEAGALDRGHLKLELFAAVVELTTDPCDSVEQAAEELRSLRRAAHEAAGRLGVSLAAAGTHPTALPAGQEIADDPRYRQFVDYAGISARRQGVNGLHVHVEMPDAEACFAALEGGLPWLPLVLALSANSPYLAGEETGLASNRAEVLAQLPRSGAPPVFGSIDGWERFVGRFIAAGLADDYTRFWWDVRPHPRFGTLEVRMPDQPTALDRSIAFVALVQTLCAHFAVSRGRRRRPRRVPAESLGGAQVRARRRAAPPDRGPSRSGSRACGRAARAPGAHRRRARNGCVSLGLRTPTSRGLPPARGRAGARPAGRLGGHRRADVSAPGVPLQTETLEVTGIRCERCVHRLAGALQGHEGLEYANANLMGQVTLQFDDARTDLDALLAAMAKAGFRPMAPA